MSPPPRTSIVLAGLGRGRTDSSVVTVREIVESLGERGFALLVALLGLPNSIPMVPPIPLVCGFLLLFVALQMVVGRHAPWLPRSLLEKGIQRDHVERTLARVKPWVEWLERFSTPRLAFLETQLAERLVGLVLVVLAVGLVFAPPIIGQIPLGLAVCLIGFGMVERDGVVVIAGTIVGTAGLSLSLGFAYAVFAGIAGVLKSIGVVF